MRILLLGAGGQVGRALLQSLVGLGDVVAATRSGRLAGSNSPCASIDLDRPATLPALLDEVAPDVVVNATGYTAVDRAEVDRDAAFRVNADAVDMLANACRTRGALLLHYSTDYVFSGQGSRRWSENDSPGPLSAYGQSKLAGEQAIRASGCEHMIFRIAWVYGPHGRNFLRTMLRAGCNGESLSVVHDQVGSPTPASWIAQATALVLARRTTQVGTWHLAAAGETSWHGFATAIFDGAVQAGLIAAVPEVRPVDSREYPSAAQRPSYSCLDTGKLAADFTITLPHWRKGLSLVLADMAMSALRT